MTSPVLLTGQVLSFSANPFLEGPSAAHLEPDGAVFLSQGRIMAIVDAYDALRSKRPYQEEVTKEEALERIQEGSRIHFDPYLVRKFLEIADQLP